MSSSRRSKRGFSLIEVMIAAALLALIASSLLSTMRFSARSAHKSRARSQASAEAQRVIDQIQILKQIADTKTTDISAFCALVKDATEGPMAGATGTCPALTITGKAISGSSLTADVAMVSTTDSASGKDFLDVTVTVTGKVLEASQNGGRDESVTIKSRFRK